MLSLCRKRQLGTRSNSTSEDFVIRGIYIEA